MQKCFVFLLNSWYYILQTFSFSWRLLGGGIGNQFEQWADLLCRKCKWAHGQNTRRHNLHRKLQSRSQLSVKVNGRVEFLGLSSEWVTLLCLSKVKIKDWVNTTSSPHFCSACLRLTWLTLLSSPAADEGNTSLRTFPPCAAAAPPSTKPPLSRRFEAKIHLQLFLSILTAGRPPVIAPVSLPSGTQTTTRDKLRQTHTHSLCCSVCVCFLCFLLCSQHVWSIYSPSCSNAPLGSNVLILENVDLWPKPPPPTSRCFSRCCFWVTRLRPALKLHF